MQGRHFRHSGAVPCLEAPPPCSPAVKPALPLPHPAQASERPQAPILLPELCHCGCISKTVSCCCSDMSCCQHQCGASATCCLLSAFVILSASVPRPCSRRNHHHAARSQGTPATLHHQAHLAIYTYAASGGVVEPEQQAQDGGLASTRGAHQAQSATPRDLEADVLEHWVALGVVKADVVKLQGVCGWCQGLGIFPVLCRLQCVMTQTAVGYARAAGRSGCSIA